MNIIKFKHLRDHLGRPFATIATDGDKVGVAICRDNDQFNKSTGRLIAEGRLKSGKDLSFKLNRHITYKVFTSISPRNEDMFVLQNDYIGDLVRERSIRFAEDVRGYLDRKFQREVETASEN